MTESTIFLIRPHRGGWQCFESEGVMPYFIGREGQRQAIDYAKGRTAHRAGEIRVLDAGGVLVESIPFDERSRRL